MSKYDVFENYKFVTVGVLYNKKLKNARVNILVENEYELLNYVDIFTKREELIEYLDCINEICGFESIRTNHKMRGLDFKDRYNTNVYLNKVDDIKGASSSFNKLIKSKEELHTYTARHKEIEESKIDILNTLAKGEVL